MGGLAETGHVKQGMRTILMVLPGGGWRPPPRNFDELSGLELQVRPRDRERQAKGLWAAGAALP